jgi:DNA polymerase III sliding clamp (beta) subunit (PCNA family)
MKLDKKFKLDKIVDSTGLRPALSYVLIDGNNAIATDGHRLVSVPIEKEAGDEERILLSTVVFKEATKIQKSKGSMLKITKDGLALTNGKYLFDESITGTKFPNYKSVIPDGPPEFSICVSVNYLVEVLDSIALKNAIRFSFYGPTKAMRIEQDNIDDGSQYAILMPVRSIRNI